MADRYLDHAISCLNRAKENATDGVYCELSIVEVDMILDLLKEREAVKIHITDDFGSIKFGHCPNCGATINSKAFKKSCGCGQAVKWE